MKLEIPFIKSSGFECGQACIAMITKYYFPEITIDINEINKFIHHRKDKYSFPLQLAIYLDESGLNTKCFSSDDIPTLKENPDIFKKWFGNEYETLIKNIDLDTYDWMAKEGRKRDLFRRKNTEFNDVIKLFEDGNTVCFPIDWNTLQNINGEYEGHFLLISGIEGDDILVHDPDIGPHVPYKKSALEKAFNHPVMEDDLIVVYGKK